MEKLDLNPFGATHLKVSKLRDTNSVATRNKVKLEYLAVYGGASMGS